MRHNTALIMIDMQNAYLSTDGVRDALGWPPIWRLEETVAECAALLNAARAAALPVIYSRGVLGVPQGANPRFALLAEHRAERMPPRDEEHEHWKQQIMDAVAPQEGDIVLEKTRPSFFEYTELEPLLTTLGVRRLIVAGLQTNVCVEATTRSALARNFEVGIPLDAVSTDGPRLHEAALDSMRVLYAEVAPWRELIAAGATWETAFTTPDYGRDPEYWSELSAASRS